MTPRAVLDALEAAYPMLRGTIRDHGTRERRAFLRFFACEEDLSHQGMDALLPEKVVGGGAVFGDWGGGWWLIWCLADEHGDDAGGHEVGHGSGEHGAEA